MAFTKKDLEAQERQYLELKQELERLNKEYDERLEALGVTEEKLEEFVKQLPPEVIKTLEEEKQKIQEKFSDIPVIKKKEVDTSTKRKRIIARRGVVKL